MPDAEPPSDDMFETCPKDLNAVEVGTWSPRFARSAWFDRKQAPSHGGRVMSAGCRLLRGYGCGFLAGR